jgi:ferredoxin
MASVKVTTAQTAKKRRRRPAIDLGACSKCGGCVEIAPEIFGHREDAGFFEVHDLDYYDADLIDEAIKFCPEDCISWENEE